MLFRSDLLEVGVHHLSDDLPDLWVVDPADSAFGAVTQMTLRSFGPLRTNMTVQEAESVLGVDLVSIQENLGGCTFVAPAGPPDPDLCLTAQRIVDSAVLSAASKRTVALVP